MLYVHLFTLTSKENIMTIIEKFKKESEARAVAMKVERAVDKKIEDKVFGRTSAVAWEIAYEKDRN